ncbi:ankyrin repeat-containing domain protein [Gorgonomyces haynaldii]|nr:ankyrin repeat-containing domain protein [Gorgonomyces haynaldii]
MSLESLPYELLMMIVEHLSNKDYCTLHSTNKRLSSLRDKERVWVRPHNSLHFIKHASQSVLNKYHGYEEMEAYFTEQLQQKPSIREDSDDVEDTTHIHGAERQDIELHLTAFLRGIEPLCRLLIQRGRWTKNVSLDVLRDEEDPIVLDSYGLDNAFTNELTLMHLAVLSGNVNVCKMLVQSGDSLDDTLTTYQYYDGYDDDEWHLTPLGLAIWFGQSEVFEYLLPLYTSVDEVAVESALLHGETFALDAFLKVDWRPQSDRIQMLMEACSDNDNTESLPYLIKWAVEDRANWNALEYFNRACGEGDFALLQTVTKHYKPPKSVLNAGFHLAIPDDHLQICMHLFDLGCSLTHTDEQYRTPLQIALDSGSGQVVTFLIQHGPKSYLEAMTAAMTKKVVDSNELTVLKELVELGVSFPHQDAIKYLKRAVHERRQDPIQWILSFEPILDKDDPDVKELFSEIVQSKDLATFTLLKDYTKWDETFEDGLEKGMAMPMNIGLDQPRKRRAPDTQQCISPAMRD